eukprot:scaffold291001_cov12-Tisochrysis_lutea.AAC.1
MLWERQERNMLLNSLQALARQTQEAAQREAETESLRAQAAQLQDTLAARSQALTDQAQAAAALEAEVERLRAQ